MEAAREAAPLVPGNVVIKTEPEDEDDAVSSWRDVPVKREPVVPLLSPVSGLRPLSWSQDHRVAVCTSSSLSVMELVCDVHSNKQDLTLHRTSISVPNESHKLRVGRAAAVAQAMEKFAIYPDPTVKQVFLANMVINPSVGMHKGVKYASWSPIGCDSSGCCLLACLTLDNRLTVHNSCKHLEWTLLVDLSKKYSERLKERGYAKKDRQSPEADLLDFDELQRRFYMQTPRRIEWSGVYATRRVQQDNTCVNVDVVLLAVLMENGDLVLWKFELPFTSGADVEFYDLIESGVPRPSGLAWWEHKDGGRRMSGLIVGSEEGPVKIVPVGLSNVKGYCTLRHAVVLWKECDDIPAENVKCISLTHPVHKSSCSLIVASRGCYVFWCLLRISPAGLNVHNSHLAGLNSLPIVSFAVSQEDVYTASIDGWIKRLTPRLTESSVTFKVEDLWQPESLTGSRIHGIAVSHSGAYIAMVATGGVVGGFHSVHVSHKVHFLALKAPETAAELLLNSPTQNLYKTSDLLDLVRWDILKNKCVPAPLLEQLERKLQEVDSPYLLRFKLFMLRVLHQALQAPRDGHCWRLSPTKMNVSVRDDETEAGVADREDVESDVRKKQEEERRAEVLNQIRTLETRLMRANMKKVLGVVYLNTWVAQNTSVPTCGLMEYLSKDPNDRASEVLIGHVKNKMNKQMFAERCSLCQAVLPFADHKQAVCENGHVWLRCVLSHQACQALTFRRCLLQDSIARLPEPEDPEWIKKILQAPCVLCDSPMI